MSQFGSYLLNANSVRKFNYKIYEEEKTGELVSTGTLIINDGRANNDNPVGLIEDIWTHPDYRKQGLATKVMEQLISKAKVEGCYKLILCCADHNVMFYERLGFTKHQNAMRLSLTESK